MTDIFSKNKKFADAAKYCENNVSTFDNNELLELYGLYKQATVGDSPEKPKSMFSVFNMKDKAKSEAWASRKGMTPEDAANKYIEIIKKKNPEWENSTGKAFEISISSPSSSPVRITESEERKIDIENRSVIDSALLDHNFNEKNCSRPVFDAFCSQVNRNDIKYLKILLEKFHFFAKSRSSEGSTALHYACDKGFVELSDLLIKYGADPNSRDKFGDTPLHVAVVSEKYECIKLLLENGANTSILNDDGQMPLEVTDNIEIKQLISNN